ncbi:MAG: CotH kinase family protein [Anaeromassilibacillus sp.]
MIHNYYLYEDDGVLSMIPWDYNLAFGGFSSGGGATSLVNHPIDDPLLSGQMEDRPMLSWIFAEDTYLERYHQLFDEFITTYFESGAFEEMYTNTLALISPYVEADTTSFTTYETYQKASEALKENNTI